MRLIDADAVYDWYLEAFKGRIGPEEVRFSMLDIKRNLLNIPTIEAKDNDQKHGHWIVEKAIDTVRGHWTRCSRCYNASFGGGPYCGACGAQMDEILDWRVPDGGNDEK